ncbi:prefoldin subunit alpha [Candidatus Woesearchaeota archaeon]|nr:prefoldin subunit alpha [Candidatus Woesearchaeota archaeon]
MTEDKEKKAQEMYMEFQMIEQHIKQLQKQLEAVTHQLIELNSTSNSLDEFNKINAGREIFVPLSSGIFAKASIKDTSELLVNVGANVVVKKDVISTKKLIQKQMEEIQKMQRQMIDELEKMTDHAAQIEMQLQSLISQE